VVPPEDTNTANSSRPEAPGCKHLLKKQIFEIPDCMQGELSRRLCVVEPMLLSCDSVNPKSDLFLDFDTMKPLAEAYAYLGIDANNLKAQAVDLVVFTKLMLTIPVSSAGAERSVSTIKRATQQPSLKPLHY